MSKFHPDRKGRITGSMVYILFPKKDNPKTKDSYAKHLANELFFGEIDSVNTWQTTHGEQGEHHAFNHYTQYYDFNIEKGEFIKNGNFGGSPDAISSDYGIDFKCPTSLENWLDYLYDGISDQQKHQAQMYMWLTGKKVWKICAFLEETMKMQMDDEFYPVPQHQRMIIIEEHYDENWANGIEEKGKIIIQKRDEYFEQLKAQFNGK